MSNKVWFITGASKGLGLTLAQRLISKGFRVAATSRKIADLENSIGKKSDNFLPLTTDLKSEESVAASIEAAVKHFGNIDVIVNNAGYGQIGSIEELTDEESRENFNVNVFGSLNVIRKAMPFLRKQGSGHIFNISSIGGFNGAFPGFGIYCASKFAVEGFSESLAAEVKPFGVNVTIVSPGYFRTNFLDSGSLGLPKNEIEEYKLVRDVQSQHQHSINGNQAGDPVKAADVLIEVSQQADPALHLFLGSDAYQLAKAKIASVEADMKSVE
ncbi:MAG: SDR family oxidoreductase, partial [Chitinophagaceae bacterium]